MVKYSNQILKINQMDFSSLIGIAIIIVAVYFLIKFIVSPLLKLIFGIIAVLALIYFLQRFFGFDSAKFFSNFGISLDTEKWGVNLNWILNPINYYADQIKSFLNYIWNNFIGSFGK